MSTYQQSETCPLCNMQRRNNERGVWIQTGDTVYKRQFCHAKCLADLLTERDALAAQLEQVREQGKCIVPIIAILKEGSEDRPIRKGIVDDLEKMLATLKPEPAPPKEDNNG